MKRTLPLVISFAAVTSPAVAVDFRFETYGEALDGILGPGVDLAGCPGLINLPAGTDPASSPEFAGYFDLSPELQRQCQKANNFTFGATLGAGFSSPFSTRTYVPFTTGTVVASPQTSASTAASQDAVTFPGGGRVRIGGGGEATLPWRSFVSLEIARVDTEGTRYEIGGDGTRYKASVAVEGVISQSLVLGLALSGERGDMSYDAPQSFLTGSVAAGSTGGRTQAEIDTTIASYNAACDRLGEPTQDRRELDLTLYGIQDIGAASLLQISGGVTWRRSSYETPLCIYNFDDSFTDSFFAGTIKGDADSYELHASALLQTTFAAGAVRFTPAAQLSVSRQFIPGYSEDETGPPAGLSVPVAGSANTSVANPTGAALKYKGREIDSLQSRLSLITLVPVHASGSFAWLDVGYTHEFWDGNRTVEARFAGDGRDDPTTFSFRTNPIDRDYFEVSLGLNILRNDRVSGGLWVASVLEHDYYSEDSLGAFVSIDF